MWPTVVPHGELDVVSLALIEVSSEEERFSIDNIFDRQRGPGGSCWMAEKPGEQTVTLAFHTPQRLRTVSIEVEEHGNTRTQHVMLSISQDGGKRYDKLLARAFTFSPYGQTFQRETWFLSLDAVTHLHLRIAPHNAKGPGRASLTSLVLR
jgi:hypothetical protein